MILIESRMGNAVFQAEVRWAGAEKRPCREELPGIVRPRGARAPGAARRLPGPRAGFVLVIVMVVVALVSLAGLSFVQTLSTENKAVHVQGDQIQLEQVVGSGVELVRSVAAMPGAERQQLGGLFNNPSVFQNVVVVEGDRRRAKFSVFSPKVEDGQVTGIRFGLQNESARLNLAVLSEWDQQEPRAAERALMQLPGMTESIAAAILDWIDTDDAPRTAGAEADYYAGQGLPYGPRNAIPTSLDELLLVRDVRRELLFGADADLDYLFDDEGAGDTTSPATVVSTAEGLPWALFLTVYSAERNVTYEGRPRIYLNEPDLEKLHGQLVEAFDPKWARFIIAYRQFGPSQESPDDDAEVGWLLEDEEGEREPVSARDEVVDLSRPARFKIASVLDLVGARVELPPSGQRGGRGRRSAKSELAESESSVLLESPFADDPTAMQEYLPRLMDLTTVVADEVLRGRVNLNEAPREVLLGVPGLDASTVDRILAARSTSPAEGDPVRRQVTWLLVEGIVDLEQMKQLLPYLTTGGDVFRAQVTASFDDGGVVARAEVVVDATVSPPRQLYWKELRLLGPGPSTEGQDAGGPEAMVGLEELSGEGYGLPSPE